MKKIVLIFFIALIPLMSVLPQQDTAKSDNEWNFKFRFKRHFKKLKITTEKCDNEKSSGPFISLMYGAGDLKNFELSQKFNRNGIAVFQIGSQDQYFENRSHAIKGLERTYLEGVIQSKELFETKTAGNLSGRTFHFGFGWDDGLGYSWGNTAIFLTNATTLGWTRLKLDTPAVSFDDQGALNPYVDKFKFTFGNAGGIKIQPIKNLSLDAYYDQRDVYARVIFWKAVGSLLIEKIAHSIADSFIDEVTDSAPYAAPIVYFVLHNGISYAVHELRKDQMNWPWDGGSPLQSNTFRFGMTFNF